MNCIAWKFNLGEVSYQKWSQKQKMAAYKAFLDVILILSNAPSTLSRNVKKFVRGNLDQNDA